jgi:hypothetical protein
MTIKREGRVVWFALFRFRGDPLMIVPGVLKGILQSLSSVLLWVLSLRPPSLFLRWLYIGIDPGYARRVCLISPKMWIHMT